MQILNTAESVYWRELLIEVFIDTQKDFYQKHILKKIQYADGAHYTGYLWDCLKIHKRISERELFIRLADMKTFLTLADDHSKQKISDANLWPFPPLSVVRFSNLELLSRLSELPEDFYCFSENLKLLLVRTHEDDGKRRICLIIEY